MPPEQNVGDGHPQSDLYSLGVTALEMLLGKVPEHFKKGYFLQEFNLEQTHLPSGWKKILEQMVRIEYTERPASATEVRRKLREKGLIQEVRVTPEENGSLVDTSLAADDITRAQEIAKMVV